MNLYSEPLIRPDKVENIYIFSNLEGVPDPVLEPGDWCIHLNTAEHAHLTFVDFCTHSLIVRKTTTKGSIRWYAPDMFYGYSQVIFWNGFKDKPDWLKNYPRNFSPSTGFLAYHLARAASPESKIFLVGFKPGENVGTKWKGHKWSYEAKYYKDHNVTII